MVTIANHISNTALSLPPSSLSLQTATVLAKLLVKLRKQKTKSYGLSVTITAAGHQMKVCHLHIYTVQ